MASNDLHDGGYRALGILANPFSPPDDGSADPIGIRLSGQAAALALHAAFERNAGDPDHRPVFVRKADIPASYHVKALARVLADLASNARDSDLFSVYVPLDMMKMGRVRAVLSAAAERIAGVSPELTLASWTLTALREPDESLVEWGFLADLADPSALREEFESDPASAAIRTFGTPMQSREGAEDLEMLMRVSYSRQDRLETDPAEGEEGMAESENPTEDPLLEVFATPLVEDEPLAVESGEGAAEEEKPDPYELLFDYVVAYTNAQLSPVVARAIRAYSAQGTASMAQELKVSKAPTKTLAALFRFISGRFRASVIVYDRLDMWAAMPADLKIKIVSTFSSLRWTLKEHAFLCFMIVPGTAPELEETFAAALPVEWDFTELPSVSSSDASFDSDIALKWLAAASLDGSVPDWGEEIVAAVPNGAALAEAVVALATTIDTAASSGLIPDSSKVLEALEAAREAPST